MNKYVHIHIRTHTYTYIYIYMYIDKKIFMYINIHICIYPFLYQHLAFGCSKMFPIAQVVEAASPRAPDESHMGGSTAGDTATDAKDFF